MNKQPIEEAADSDIRLSIVALRRAALRAREIARLTGTDSIEDGELPHVSPSTEPGAVRSRVRDGD